MTFARMKISTRLTIGFGSLVLLALASSGLSLYKLGHIQDNLDEVVHVNNTMIELGTEMSQSVHVISRVVRTVAMAEDPVVMQREVTKITAARAAYDTHWDALQKFPASDAGKVGRTKIAQAQAAAWPLNNRALEMGLANQKAEAVNFLIQEAGPATTVWQDALAENMHLQKEANERDYEKSLAEYREARAMLVGGGVFSVALALFFGLVITRSIVRQLGAEPAEAQSLAQGVAAGDLSLHIHTQPGDTTSLMVQLKEMQASLVKLVTHVRQGSESVAAASAEIAKGTTT